MNVVHLQRGVRNKDKNTQQKTNRGGQRISKQIKNNEENVENILK